MRVNSINNYRNQLSYKSGVYFTKKAKVLFDHCPEPRYIANDITKTSSDGFGYVQDNEISQEIKDKFTKMPIIRDLADKFDTFIYFSANSTKHNNSNSIENQAYARIMWKDGKEPECDTKTDVYGAKYLEVIAASKDSLQEAIDKMFKNIEAKRLCN